MNTVQFSDRLRGFKAQTACSTLQELADLLGITVPHVSMLLNNKRPPSDKILDKLEDLTGFGKSYWLYGVEDTQKYVDQRANWSTTATMLDYLYNHKILKYNSVLPAELMNLIQDAIQLDIKYIEARKNKE